MLGVFLGFVFGAFTIIVIEALALYYLVFHLLLNKSIDQSSMRGPSDLDPQQSLDYAFNKQGVVWVLESEKIPKEKEQKRRKEILEVSPVRKCAKIKDHSLILTELDGSCTTVRLKGCTIAAVSATSLLSRKWAKRYPIKVESKTSLLYNSSKTLYLYLDTSWEKESWCKALRLASFEDKSQLNWFSKLAGEFQTYLTTLNSGYTSFMKPSMGFYAVAEPVDRANKADGSSKVRLLLKKLTKKASKSGIDSNKSNSNSSSSRVERKVNDKTRSVQDSMEESVGLSSSSSTLSHSGSQSQFSVVSDADPDDKFSIDEGTLCWNLLISRFFFDAKANADIKCAMQERIQRTLSNMRTPSYIGEVICTGIDLGNLPPYIHAMRILPTDMNEVWALEIDIEYSGGALLDIKTRLEVRELDSHKEIAESSPVGEATSDLLEEYYQKQLNPSQETIDATEHKDEGDAKPDEIKSSKSNVRTSTTGSRWKSILKTVAKQVSQVPLSLTIKVASLRGTLRLHIKPPPSDQLWFGFTSMPDIDFSLESCVGDHKISSGHVASFLINRFKTSIRETLVLPNCESVWIPFMLAEKDDWVPREAAPFMWVHHEVVNDPATTQQISNTQPQPKKESAKVNLSNPPPETNHNKPKNNESLQRSITEYISSDTVLPSNPTSLRSVSLKESSSSLRGDEMQETCNGDSEKSIVIASASRTMVLTRDESLNSDDGSRPKKVLGRREKMRDLGKKMGEKLEEKRRHIEERSRSIVDKMRGP